MASSWLMSGCRSMSGVWPGPNCMWFIPASHEQRIYQKQASGIAPTSGLLRLVLMFRLCLHLLRTPGRLLQEMAGWEATATHAARFAALTSSSEKPKENDGSISALRLPA